MKSTVSKFAITFIFVLCYSVITYAQKSVGINTLTPNSHAVLELIAPDGNQGLLVPKLTTAQRTATAFTGALSETENGLLVYDSDENSFYYWKTGEWQNITGSGGTNWFSGSGAPGSGIGTDGDWYLNTDNGDLYKKVGGVFQFQLDLQIEYTAGTGIEITAANEIINTGDADADPQNELQDIELTGNDLNLTNSPSGTPVDLTIYLDNTDSQTLSQSVAGDEVTLEISNGNIVSFSRADADADPANELITSTLLSGTELQITDAGGIHVIDFSPISGDNQTLSLSGNQLLIENGNFVDLSFLLDNTDNQDLSITGNSIGISGGTGFNLSSAVPNSGEVLKWDGAAWTAAPDANTAYTAGTGIDLTGNTVTNTAPDQTVTLTGTGATAVTGTYPDFTVSSTDTDNQDLSITGNNIGISGGTGISLSATAPVDGEVLKWNDISGQWEAAADASTAYTAGTGIDLTGNTVTNTAPDQTVTLTGTGATAVTGTYPDFTVSSTDTDNQDLSITGNSIGISGGTGISLSAAVPNSGEVLKWDGAAWTAAPDASTAYTAGTGIDLTGNTVTNTAPDQTVTLTGTGATTITGAYPNFTVSSTDTDTDNQNLSITGNSIGISGGTGISLSAAVPNSGEVLKWDGAAWTAAPDANTAYTAGTGIDLTGNTVTNTAPDQTVTLTGTGATAVTGTYPDFTISSTDNVNDADADPANEIQNVSISGNSIGISGGTGFNLSSAVPNSGEVLKWDGAAWTAAPDASTAYTAGTGIDLTGNTVTNTAPDQTVTLTGTGATTITGTYPDFTVSSTDTDNQDLSITGNSIGISGGTGFNLSSAVPNSGEVLKWDGAAWTAAPDANTAYTAGTGIDLTGNTVTNTAPDQTVTLTGTGATAVTGTYPDFTVSSTDTDNQDLSITGNSIGISGGTGFNLSSAVPNSGEVLKWDGAAWTAAPDASTAYTAGTGIDLTGNTVTNTAPDQTVTLTGTGATAVTGTYPNFTVSSTDNVNDADADPANEIQNVSISGNSIGISGGTGFNLAAVAPTAGQVLKWDGTKWTSDVDFDKQTLTITPAAGGNYSLDISGGNSISFAINDADASVSNEVISSTTLDAASYQLDIVEAGTSHTTDLSPLRETGTLTASFVPRFDGSLLQNGVIQDNGTSVGIGGAPSASYTLFVNGKLKSAGVNELSDRRLKTNITPLSNALERVLNLNGVSYNWRTTEFPERNFSEEREIGVIAQEVEQWLPEVVTTDEEGFKSVQYGHLTAVLIEAVKEQQQLIEQQQLEIEKLKADNERMAADNERIEALEAQMQQMHEQFQMLQESLNSATTQSEK